MQGVRYPIPVPGTCWGRRAMSFASILLPFGSRIPVPGSRIPVPGTCWSGGGLTRAPTTAW